MISDAFGVTTSPTSCEPAYRSTGNRGADLAKAATEYGTSNGRCGPAYHIFFTTPAADLPAAAQLGNGQTIYVNPAIQTPTITSLEWEPAAEGSYGGTFTGELTRIGGVPADVGIDVDEDGTPDIIVTGAIDGDGHFTASWDGRDDDGNLVPIGNTVTASLTISRMGEIHFLRADVERSGGIRVRRLNGQDPGWVALQWDDSQLAGGLSGTDEGANRACSTPALTGPGAADGSFVHGWYTGPCGDGYPWGGGPNSPSLNSNNGTDGGWGDARQIADWTYEEFQAAPYTIRLGELPTIEVIKNVRSRVAGSSDEFTVGVSTSNGTEVTAVSTAGTVASATTGPQGVLPDRTYTVFENTTSGSNPLTGYTASLACVDRTGATVPTSGTAGDWTLRTPDGPVFSGPGDPPIVAADITCTITNVAKDAPAAAPDWVVVEQGATATLDPVVTPGSGAITAVAFDNGSTTKVVPGEGTWEIELTAGGSVVASFTPETGFTGPVTQQRYTVTDQNGLTASSTLDVIIQPAAGDASATIRPGETATLEPIVTPGSGAITGVAFDNGETTKQVPGEGSWTIELTDDGDVVARFTPEEDYTGPVTPQPYTVTDQNGLTATGTLEVVIVHAGLLLEKDYAAVSDANGNGISDAGDVVRWTFTVTNTGTLTLEDVRVDDPLLVDLGIAIDCEQTTLAAGATTSCESDEYTITQADVRAGSIRNVATATAEVPPGTPGDPENPVSPPAEVELPTAPDPSLPVTGAQVGLMVALAAVLLLAGGGLLLASRRRRDPEASE
ncbi:MAG: LPXTG cell wall anchor domain-containing protein [Propionicimonas sp.]